MQSLTVLFLQNTSQQTTAIPCDGTDRKVCNKLSEVYNSGNYSFQLNEFQDLPAFHESVKPFIQAWNLSKFPALAFLNGDNSLAFYAIDGGKITNSKIKAAFDFAENYIYVDGEGYLNSDGQGVDPTQEIESQAGSIAGVDFGFSFGLEWGKCSDYLPTGFCKTPWWIYVIIIVVLAAITIKIFK